MPRDERTRDSDAGRTQSVATATAAPVARPAPAPTPSNETEEGGRYMVAGQEVNADGRPFDKKAAEAQGVEPAADHSDEKPEDPGE